MDLFDQLHLLRPWWLLALIPLPPLIFFLWKQQKNSGQWQDLIAPHLLPFLLEGKTVKTPRRYLFVLLAAWILSAIALAGPSWKKAPVAVEKNDKALVILLDLSPSMLTEDIKPSRIIRARLKIADLLRERPDGQTALLVYGADAHVVTPLTDDAKTINNLLPMLSPKLMPAQGSNTEAAVARAIKLLTDAGLQQGDLLLITDGVETVAQETINELLSQHSRIRLSILGVGGKEPAPIPSNNGGFIRDRNNNIITSHLDVDSLRQFAENNRGRYKTLSSDVNDVKVFTQLTNMKILDADNKEPSQKSNRQYDQWTDEGHWLVFLLLPIIAYAFRRGVLLSLILVPILFATPEKAYALGWDELWKNKKQIEHEKLKLEEVNNEALNAFKKEDYETAAKAYYEDPSATGRYNLGNSLAKLGYLSEAIEAYDEALRLNPKLEDAKKNRKIVEDALKKQQEQQNNKDQNQQDQNNSDQQKQDQKKQDQQDQQQKKQDQQNQNQQDQNSDQQKSDQQQNSSSGQNSYNQNQSQENASQSSQGNQSQMDSQTSSSAASQMNQAAQTSSAQSEEQKSDEQKEAEAKALAKMQKDGLTEEERKNLEQWLRRVQDDPSGLLRRKFEYEYRKQQSEKYKGTWESPDNEADQRL